MLTDCPLFRLVWGGPAVHHVWVWWWRLWPRWMQGQNLACLHVVDVQDEQCGPLSCWVFNGPLYSVFLSLMSLVFLIVSVSLIVLRWPCVVDRTLKSNYCYSQSHTSSALSLALFTCSFSHAIYTYRSKCRRRRKNIFLFLFIFYASSHGFFSLVSHLFQESVLAYFLCMWLCSWCFVAFFVFRYFRHHSFWRHHTDCQNADTVIWSLQACVISQLEFK